MLFLNLWICEVVLMVNYFNGLQVGKAAGDKWKSLSDSVRSLFLNSLTRI